MNTFEYLFSHLLTHLLFLCFYLYMNRDIFVSYVTDRDIFVSYD
jgi:hypothetical protein